MLNKKTTEIIGSCFFDWGGVVENIRTVFEKMDRYVYIPDLR